jgi:hypothetical protein
MRPATRPLSLLARNRRLRITFLTAAITFAGCVPRAGATEAQRQTPDHAAVDRAVRAMMKAVAHDVTQDGPATWLKYFELGPAFFMAVNGQMSFPNAAAAQDGTRKFAQITRQIELTWGNDLRVDPLTADLAMVASSWHETIIDNTGHKTDGAGYFTGLVENHDGHWQFRDAHWSSPAPTCP